MTAPAPWQPLKAEVEKWANQGRTAKTHWVWTELTESLRGIAYSADYRPWVRGYIVGQ